MSSISVPAPGKKIRDPQDRRKWIEIGPCVKPCVHQDCQANRELAAAVCSICGEPIGYDHQFFVGGDGQGYEHAVCVYHQIDARRAQQQS